MSVRVADSDAGMVPASIMSGSSRDDPCCWVAPMRAQKGRCVMATNVTREFVRTKGVNKGQTGIAVDSRLEASDVLKVVDTPRGKRFIADVGLGDPVGKVLLSIQEAYGKTFPLGDGIGCTLYVGRTSAMPDTIEGIIARARALGLDVSGLRSVKSGK